MKSPNPMSGKLEYVAKSPADIAELFRQKAADAARRADHTTGRLKLKFLEESRTWDAAARVLDITRIDPTTEG